MIYINGTNLKIEQDSAVTLGNFDGVHLGHKLLIDKMREYSKAYNLKSIVFSFKPHPISVINNTKFSTILSNEEKVNLFSSFDIDYFIEYPFTKQFSNTDSTDFIINYLVSLLNCKVLVVGEDYKFGRDLMSNTTVLQEICQNNGIQLVVIPLYKSFDGTEKIGSRFIREFILQKELEEAQRLLGRPYFITGKILNGRKIGRTIGFPTVNMITDENKILPPNGVYCTKTLINGDYYDSITNIGIKPTISDTSDKIKTVETHIFDFNKQVYDDIATVYFYKWIRDEVKFNSIDELKQQINIDVLMSKEIHGIINKQK